MLTLLREHKEVLLVIGSGDDHQAMIGQIERFKASKPRGQVAVFTDRQRPSEALAAFRAGANACFARGTSSDAFIKSLDLVLLGETLMPATLLMLLPSNEQPDNAPLDIAAPLARNDEAPNTQRWKSDSSQSRRRRFKQGHRPQGQHRRSDRKSSHQSDLAQAAAAQPDAGGGVGHEQRLALEPIVSGKLETFEQRDADTPGRFPELPRLSAHLVASE